MSSLLSFEYKQTKFIVFRTIIGRILEEIKEKLKTNTVIDEKGKER
jgi:hypothetical protein